MTSLQEALASIWDALNPVEPSTKYLAIFMGAAVILFFLSYWLGQALAAA